MLRPDRVHWKEHWVLPLKRGIVTRIVDARALLYNETLLVIEAFARLLKKETGT